MIPRIQRAIGDLFSKFSNRKTQRSLSTTKDALRFESLEERICLTANFDFEGEALAENLSSLTMTDDGLTVTITKDTTDFAIRQNAVVPPSWGDRFLAPDDFSSATERQFIADFSGTVSDVTIDAGDNNLAGNSDADTITLKAFDGAGGTGTELASQQLVLSGDVGFHPMTLQVSAAGIRSITFVGGAGAFPNSVVWDNLTAEAEVVAGIAIQIDVKPGSDQSVVNLRANGVIPVAILTTDIFDALSVDLSTVMLGDPNLAGQIAARSSHATDVDGDGDIDLLLHFSVRELRDAGALDASSTSLELTGTTLDGQDVHGISPIRLIVPPGQMTTIESVFSDWILGDEDDE